MPWSYDVHTCESDSHDSFCAMKRVGEYGEDWKAAYKDAAERPHAFVMRRNTANDRQVVSFKHTAGGGLCHTCARYRGPAYDMVGLGLVYLCDRCIRGFYQDACDRAKAYGRYRPEPYRPALEKALS
ncbi:hypothetical protein ABZT34_10465 [Streptomyces sp. NPDC005329]|uniref:hypothetical protein n=1 Tax=Streptomyces sp. NPDC005329 TaxID=3157034 RepID=UPI0033B33AEB